MGLDTVEFVLMIESEFQVSIPDDDLEDLGIIGELTVYLVNACEMKNGDVREFEDVYAYLKHTLIKEFAVSEEKISLRSHIVRDLGLD